MAINATPICFIFQNLYLYFLNYSFLILINTNVERCKYFLNEIITQNL